jgi:hypothetical protein
LHTVESVARPITPPLAAAMLRPVNRCATSRAMPACTEFQRLLNSLSSVPGTADVYASGDESTIRVETARLICTSRR